MRNRPGEILNREFKKWPIGYDRMNTPVLYIFSGLPAVGKSTIAQAVASNLAAAYLRIDTIEQGLRDLCGTEVEGEGYRLSYRIAEDNLKIGRSVVADSCNPIELTRREWEDCALGVEAEYRNIEIVCSDEQEHRDRVETRTVPISGLVLPSWQDVQAREYHPWSRDVVRIDTARRPIAVCIDELMKILT